VGIVGVDLFFVRLLPEIPRVLLECGINDDRGSCFAHKSIVVGMNILYGRSVFEDRDRMTFQVGLKCLAVLNKGAAPWKLSTFTYREFVCMIVK